MTSHQLGRRLGQIGIDIRQSGNEAQMRFYLSCLHQEIEMTQRFILEDYPTPTLSHSQAQTPSPSTPRDTAAPPTPNKE